MSEKKVYEAELYVPYDKKDEVKQFKCYFNPTAKAWMIKDNNEHYDEMINLYSKTYLKNFFENKDLYKLHGARWSPAYKKWFTYSSNEPLKQYFE